MIIYIKNETDYKVDLCCGADQEFTIAPGEVKKVEMGELDYIYIDQVIED